MGHVTGVYNSSKRQHGGGRPGGPRDPDPAAVGPRPPLQILTGQQGLARAPLQGPEEPRGTVGLQRTLTCQGLSDPKGRI